MTGLSWFGLNDYRGWSGESHVKAARTRNGHYAVDRRLGRREAQVTMPLLLSVPLNDDDDGDCGRNGRLSKAPIDAVRKMTVKAVV